MEIEVKDFRGAPEPSAEERQELEAKREADEVKRRDLNAARLGYTLPPPAPSAKLNSGYSIPLVGLGTW